MPAFTSHHSSTATSSTGNKQVLLEALQEQQNIYSAMEEKAQKSLKKYRSKDKLLPRERIELLLDRGSPFIEICPLAGYRMEDDRDGSTCGGGVIGGIALVAGHACLVVANNSAIKGGVISPTGLQKILRLQEIAIQNRLPLLTLSESGGANLNYASQVFVEGARTFANQARLSALGVPQITIVHGNATAGGAYQPGLSDYVIVVRGKSKMFLAGPPLLRAATGEIATDEELGGAQMHASTVGTGEYLAEDDADAIRYARELMGRVCPQPTLSWPELSSLEPLYPSEELLEIIPSDTKKPFDIREVMARIVDRSELLEFKSNYDQGTICTHATLYGQKVGIIGNNAPITCDGATKAAQFMQLCDQSGIPLIFLHNTTGFMVGTDVEQNGIIKHGSKMIQAVTNTRVPKISLVISGSYGAGNYAMCGRGFDPHFIFAWPNSRVAVMGGEQAGKVMRIVTEAKANKLGQVMDAAMLDQMETMTRKRLESESTALYGTARLWDDGIIDPRHSRALLGFLIKVCTRDLGPDLSNTFGISRF